MSGSKGTALFVRATRARVVPVMLAPVVVGSALAWERAGAFSWWRFAVTLAGAAAMHLGSNVVNDVFDEESGAENAARRDHRSVATGSGVLGAGLMSKAALMRLAGALFGAALACGLALGVTGRPAVLWLGAIGFVLAYLYAGPPVRYGYVGRGLGEAGIFVAFGVLPVAGSYYVQSGSLDAAAFWASIAPGLATTLVLYHHHFLHWQSDREVRKMTPVAALGPQISLAVGRIGVTVVVIVLALQTLVFRLWPPGAFAAAAFVAPVVVAQARAAEEPENESYVKLLGSSLGSSILIASALAIASVVRVALR